MKQIRGSLWQGKRAWSIFDILAEYALKHFAARWVTLQKVLVRWIEQYDNLKEHFLTFLSTASSFKANAKKSFCNKIICDNLNSNFALCYLSIVAYFASDFESFSTRFQSMKPLIHIFYWEMETLLWNVMAKFVKSKYLTGEGGLGEMCMSVTELLLM